MSLFHSGSISNNRGDWLGNRSRGRDFSRSGNRLLSGDLFLDGLVLLSKDAINNLVCCLSGDLLNLDGRICLLRLFFNGGDDVSELKKRV